jgi:hypothetical protein
MSEYKLNPEQRGRAAAMYRAHADGDGVEDLVYRLVWLTDRVDELEPDAARYRYIRDYGEEFIGEDRGAGPEWLYGDVLDEAVDEARSKP